MTSTYYTGEERSKRIFAIVGASSGNLVEWFDFYVYAFCAIYFAPAFFPSDDPTVQLLNTAGVFAEYEVSDSLKPYLEFMFMDDRTVAQIAPSGNFGNTLSINCDNPLLGAGQRAALCNNANLLVSPLPGDAFILTGNVAAENAARAARGLGEPILPTTPFGFIDPKTQEQKGLNIDVAKALAAGADVIQMKRA